MDKILDKNGFFLNLSQAKTLSMNNKYTEELI